MFRKLVNSRGFGLIQVMVGIGIAGILTLAILSMAEFGLKSNLTVDTHQKIQSSIDEIRLLLGNSNICAANFGGKRISVTTLPAIQSGSDWDTLALKRVGAGGALGQDVAKAGLALGGSGLTFSKVAVSIYGNQGSTYYADLNLDYTVASGKIFGSSTISRKLPLRFTINDIAGVKTVAGCGSQAELGLSCHSKFFQEPQGQALSTAKRYECDSPTAQITQCDAAVYMSGESICGTNVIAGAGGQKPYCQTHGCNAFAIPRYWGVKITCCESGEAVAAATTSAPTMKCSSFSSPWGAWANGTTKSVSCPVDQFGVTCNATFYDTNNTNNNATNLTYTTTLPQSFDGSGRVCSATAADGGISEGQVTATCCKFE